MADEEFLKEYEKLLDKGYCDCNEMNCIDNNAPRRILNIAKQLKEKLEQKNKIIIEMKNNLCNLEREMIIILNSNYDYSKIQICEKVLDYQREIEDILNKGVDKINKAEIMFNELGFKKVVLHNKFILYTLNIDDDENYITLEILFNIKSLSVTIYMTENNENCEAFINDKKIFYAIIEQLKELEKYLKSKGVDE